MTTACPRFACLIVVALSTAWNGRLDAEAKISLVLSNQAPPLERLAAEELAAQFQLLWQADVSVSESPSPGAQQVILIGSPATNPAVKAAMGGRWPRLSEQGFVLRSTKSQNQSALIVGGGSPVATLWAAYELGHRLGVRYLISGDVYPAESPALSIDGWDVVMEPQLRARAWRTVNDFPIGPEAWGLDEQRRVLRQIAKLKFNRVLISIYPWQPFVDYEFHGIKKVTGVLWFGYHYPIDRETPGRGVFKGAKEFFNPDLAAARNYAESIQAGTKLIQGIIDEAHRLGMSAALSFSPLEFPKEFAAALPDAKVLHQLESLTIGPGAKQPPDDKLLQELASAQLQALLKTYPAIDAIYLTLPEFPEWDEHAEAAWKRLDARTGLGKLTSLADLEAAAANRNTIASGARGVKSLRGNITTLDFLQTWLADPKQLQRPDGSSVELQILDVDPALYPYLEKVLPVAAGSTNFIDYTARRVAENQALLKTLATRRGAAISASPSLIFTLADDNVGVLPQLATAHLHSLVKAVRDAGWAGYSTRYWIPSDLDPCLHYLSRAGFDDQFTPDAAYLDLVLPSCGEGVGERLIIGGELIARATDLIDQHDLGFAFPVPGMVMKHYAAGEPAPAWWQEAADHYANAMSEMYRAHDRANPAGRKLLYGLARRYEFGFEYMNAMQAVRAAAVAREKHDAGTQLAKLEAASESLYNGLTALSTVAANEPSYQGVIAVVTEYGYRPLLREIEKLQDAP
ncbi:MAG: alpha-glucuronidase family glycosyl hydrolase [Planctomycetaceae bacterium]